MYTVFYGIKEKIPTKISLITHLLSKLKGLQLSSYNICVVLKIYDIDNSLVPQTSLNDSLS